MWVSLKTVPEIRAKIKGGVDVITFFVCLAILIVGFLVYGKLVEKVFHIDDRQTPAVAHPDGVDYVPMKTWRIFLVQLLNIAGLGPIYGAIAGACWGPVVYLWIVFGTILGGGVHDFLSGMMSERTTASLSPRLLDSTWARSSPSLCGYSLWSCW